MGSALRPFCLVNYRSLKHIKYYLQFIVVISKFSISGGQARSHSHGARRLRPRRTSLVAKRTGFYHWRHYHRWRCATPSPAAQCGPDRRGRPNALASVGFVPGAKARSAPQSRGLASLVRVTWCSACSPHGSAGSTGRAEAVVGITCPKPAGRRCWVATAGDCTSSDTGSAY